MKKITMIFALLIVYSVAFAESQDVTSEMEKKFAAAIKSNDEARVVETAAEILGRDSEHLETLNAMGVFYYRSKKLGLAKLIIQRALKTNEDHGALLNNLGVIYLAQDDMRQALETFKKASEKRNANGRANLSSILVTYGDYEKAIDPLEDAYSDIKGNIKKSGDLGVAVANNYAVALMGAGKGKPSADVFETIVESGVRVPEVYLNYAYLLIDVLDKKSDAQRILSKIQFMTEDSKILKKVSELEGRAK